MVLYNPGPNGTDVSFEAWTEPVDIYKIRSSPPAPVGIADYGVANYSGTLSPYVETFNEAIGYATIYSLSATPQATSVGGSTVSLQLNIMLVANGSQQNVYWLQGVALFNTNRQTVYFEDSIWNADFLGAQLSQPLAGKGRSYGEYYAYIQGPEPYSMPLHLALLIAERVYGGTLTVSFGYQLMGQRVVWYDNVSIAEPGLKDAFMEVNGQYYTPIGNFYDAELVFGGPANGAETQITSINASLKLEYIGEGGPMLPRQLYGFGSDTAETALGAGTRLVGGVPYVLPGQVSFEPLYEAAPQGFSATVEMKSPVVEYVVFSPWIYSNVEGGLPPYTYIIYINGSRVAEFSSYLSEVNTTLSLPALPSGRYNVTVVIRDAAGATASFNLKVSVLETPLAYLLSGEAGLYASAALAALGFIIYFISKRRERNSLYYGYLSI